MAVKHKVRRFVQKRGFDVVRYPLHDPLTRTAQLINYYGVNCVVDIGANDGGFATSIRRVGYAGRIVSFEPLQKPYDAIVRKAAGDDKWDVHKYAIGATSGDVTINVSDNDGLSSSVLPMLDSHLSAAPYSRYVGSETVKQERLDALLPAISQSSDDRVFLKIDVQGYEAAVLDGATGLFEGGRVVGLQLELSLTPLYEGAMTYQTGLDRAKALGMSLMGVSPVFTDPKSGRLLQFDAVFFKE